MTMIRGNRTIPVIVPLLALLFLSGIFWNTARAFERKIPESHPIQLADMPVCTECHSDDTGVALKPVATFNHSSDFISGHRFYASQSSRLCNACHKASFCADCHASREELKPSEKYSGSPERWLPHRGDYLFQHRIDGRIDPSSCYRCHGTQNNRVCRRCHK
jgi:hypothetical protein